MSENSPPKGSVTADKIPEISQSMIDKIDPNGFYKVTIQIGGMRSWGTYSGIRRSVQTRGDGTSYVPAYVPKVCHVEEPITGKVLAGLMGEHNLWLKGFKRKEPLCDLDYQLVVLDHETTSEVPPALLKSNAEGMFHVAYLESIVNAILDKKTATTAS